jgi:ribosome-associated toxin RatA of RatAB toxin-antitoxin module
VLGLLLLTVSLAQATPGGVEVTPQKDQSGAPGLLATFDVEAPADVVLDLLWDVRRFRQIFPDIKELEVKKTHAEHDIEVQFFVDAVVAKPTYTLRRRLDVANKSIRWESTGGDLKRIAGSWRVKALSPTRSRVVYESYVDVGVFGVSGLYRDLVVGKVDQMAGRIRASLPTTLPAAAAPATPTAPTAPAPADPAPPARDPPRTATRAVVPTDG